MREGMGDVGRGGITGREEDGQGAKEERRVLWAVEF